MTADNQPILGLHLSPRPDGSSRLLLDRFQKGVIAAGGAMDILAASGRNIEGCRGCGDCYVLGECVIQDDMNIFYEAVAKATRIVVSTPVFFYGVPAIGKAVIDRLQVFWSRIYKLNQKRSFPREPKGMVLAVGATRGKDLFIPIKLCAKYLFDAIGFPRKFPFAGYRRIEEPKDWPLDQLDEVEGYGRAFASDTLDLIDVDNV
ncbi:MAG: flavodoxin family protein [Deltaproteobacteria bacterium]|jgi:multimeric flavodoxin WrbA|nr:flavodoxin family protein [Deltaproteobacteria bacterium]